MRPLFWLSTIAQGANKVPQRGVSLPFIGSLRVLVDGFPQVLFLQISLYAKHY